MATGILKGTENVALLEMNIKITDTFTQPLIGTVFKNEYGQVGFSVVRVLVLRFLEAFGFSTKHSDTQIDTITVDTLTHFQYESLQDILLFFKMARSGKFGATMKGVDSNLIFGVWFPKYMELKAIERERIVQNEKARLNNLDSENVVSAFYKDHRLKKQKDQERNNAFAAIDKMCGDMDKQVLEDTIADWTRKNIDKEYLDYLKRKRLVITK